MSLDTTHLNTYYKIYTTVTYSGFPKCASTDFYDKLSHHPQIFTGTMKEYHWWTKKRRMFRPFYYVTTYYFEFKFFVVEKIIYLV